MTDIARILWLGALVVCLALLPGCAKPPQIDRASICTGTLDLRKQHARALMKDSYANDESGGGGALTSSLITGQRLLSAMQAACKES